MPNGNEAAAQMMTGQVMGEQGGGPPPVDPAVVEKGRGLIYELTDLITSDPNIMLALEQDLIGFGMTIKEFAGGGGGQQQQGPPGMGAGPPPPGASPMGGGGPPMAGGMPPPGAGPPPGGQGPQGF